MNRVPVDQNVRDAIRTQLDRTMLIEAAAGTGKTTSLVARMTALVETATARASTIAAITFTVKAAAQLRERFQESVERKVKDTHDDVVRERLEKGLVDMNRGFIGTTHAFCARLLRERPVEAGLDPEFEEIDEVVARQLTSEFWTGWWAREAGDGNPVIAETMSAGLDRQMLREAFEKVVEHPDVTFVSTRTSPPQLEKVCNELCALLDKCEPDLPTDANRERPDQFEKMIVALLRSRRSLNLSEVKSQLKFLQEGNHASRIPTQRNWPHKETAKAFGLEYSDFVKNTLRPALERWREYVHGVAIDLLVPAAEDFLAERRRNGTLTFQDLLLFARDMLRDHPPVRRYFQRRFTHLLVDEFQDTDPLQAEVMMFLTADDAEEKRWRELVPRPGSLFIVGDPKQSIYRFRRADITTYLDVKRRVEATGGVVMPLRTNFRSMPPVCSFVNETFTTLFSKDDVIAGRQAEHVELEPYQKAAPLAGVYLLNTSPATHDAMAADEARCVGNWIRQSVAGGMEIDDDGVTRKVRWSDFLLVSWGRKRLPIYARTFEDMSVPYEITGSRAFSAAPELESAMPLLRAMVDPEDQVSVVAFLRGPLCGVDDDALYRFHKAGGRYSPFRPAPEDSDDRIRHGLEVLRLAIDDSRKHPPAAAIGRLFERLGLLPLAVTGDQPGTRSGAIVLALTIARELSGRGESLPAIVDALGDLLELPPEVEELDIEPGRSDSVRLMNLHQVKGLEAPVVFLIDPADEYDFDAELFVDRSSGESNGYLPLFMKWGKGKRLIGQPPEWDQHAGTEKQFKEAEKKRQLYVAATRAKHMLVIGSPGADAGAWRQLVTRAKTTLFSAPESSERTVESEAAVHEFERARSDIESRFELGRDASYSVLPITRIAHADHKELVKAEEGLGKGTSWGRVLHRLFEAMLLDESIDVSLLASNLLKDEERDSADLDEVMKVVNAVQASQLWARVKTADERYVEIPFALCVPRSKVGVAGEGDTLLHGIIDLVFREGNHWFVVDYKTDSTKGRLPWLVEHYRLQVKHYTNFWARITGAETTGGLFFVDTPEEVWF